MRGMSPRYDAVIIGGGAMGLSVGYNLIKRGMKSIVLEGDYLNAGSTGRSMGILKERIHHAIGKGNEDLIRIAHEGLKLHGSLSSETGINTFFRKSGCLMIAKNEDELRTLEKHQSYLRSHNLRDEFLSPDTINKRWSFIDSNGLLGGFFSPSEGIVHPFGLVWAFLESIKRMKGKVEKQNWVKKISRSSEGYKIEAEKDSYEAENVVIACGANSSELLGQMGFEIHLTPLRKEVLISEPIRPFFGPTIERLSKDYQIAQTMRGEVLGTLGYMSPGYDLSETTSKFLNEFAEETISILPNFRHLRIIRQWTGICDKTPDELPFVGRLDDGLYTTCGHYDYGITLSPIVGRLLADLIINGTQIPLLKLFDPARTPLARANVA